MRRAARAGLLPALNQGVAAAGPPMPKWPSKSSNRMPAAANIAHLHRMGMGGHLKRTLKIAFPFKGLHLLQPF